MRESNITGKRSRLYTIFENDGLQVNIIYKINRLNLWNLFYINKISFLIFLFTNYAVFWPDFQALETTHTVTNNTPTEIAIPPADWKKLGAFVVVVSAIFLIFYTKWRLRGYEHNRAISGANSDMSWFVKLFSIAVIVSMIAYAVISSFLWWRSSKATPKEMTHNHP